MNHEVSSRSGVGYWGMSSILVACSLQGQTEEHVLAATAPLRVAAERAPQRASRSQELPLDGAESIPVPPASGPVLAALRMVSPVYATADKHAEKIGYLRIGARVARSDQPVSLRDCPDGWYALRPLGFVCAGDDTSVDLEHPLARAIQVEPDRSRPLPYAYALTRTETPNYLRVPTVEEQLHTEPRPMPGSRASAEPLEVYPELGANDVPLDGEGLATGPISSLVRPGAAGERFGGDGRDSVPWWLAGERRIPNFSLLDAAPRALFTDRVPGRAGVALLDSFVANDAAPWRRFAVSCDGRILPAEKLVALPGSAFHGESLREVGLPVAFGWKPDAQLWSLEEEDGPRVLGRLARRQFVPVTATMQSVDGVRYLQTRGGSWLRSDDVRLAMRPRELPEHAQQGRRWIDVSLSSQLLVLWEGEQPVYATLVSTGRAGGQAPGSLPQGLFELQQKHVTTTLDGHLDEGEAELRDVPWVMYFNGRHALHGAYWHDDFGRMRPDGSVSLAPIDARYVFGWSSPIVPEHWHGSFASASVGRGTLVRIRL